MMDDKALARFWSRVREDPATGCWLWIGAVNNKGYGRMTAGSRRKMFAHRLSYEHFIGPVGEGLCVLHDCPSGDNAACVNPEHLWLGTHAENMADMASKGRHGSISKPERVARGDRHASRTKPWAIARGERHGWRTKPESMPKGAAHYKAKLTDEKVREMFTMKSRGMSTAAIARAVGVTNGTASLVLRRINWKHVVVNDVSTEEKTA